MSRDNQCGLDENEPKPPTPTHSIPHPRARAETPWAAAAERQHTRHAGNTEPASSPPLAPKGSRRMGTPKPSNSFSWVSNTGYLEHPQAALGARLKRMGRRQFDARARSLPTHAIQSPLTRPFRSLGYNRAKRTATPGICREATETSSTTEPAPPDAKEIKINSRDISNQRREDITPCLGRAYKTLALRLT